MAGTGPQPACPAGSAALEGWVGGAGGRCGEGHWGGGEGPTDQERVRGVARWALLP